MCLIAVAMEAHPNYPLVVAANRDEFYHRPAEALHFWKDCPSLLAGRDLREQGTWLGVTTEGRFAAVTNYREPGAFRTDARSRGRLVRDCLTSPLPPECCLHQAAVEGHRYNGFNLLAGVIACETGGCRANVWWYSNKNGKPAAVPPGIHAISNALLDTPWPKSRRIADGLRALLDDTGDVQPDAVFRLLADTRRPRDEDLPNTGVGLEWERLLSPVFVSSPGYGTRSSAVILLDGNGRLQFFERTFGPGGPDDIINDTNCELRITNQ